MCVDPACGGYCPECDAATIQRLKAACRDAIGCMPNCGEPCRHATHAAASILFKAIACGCDCVLCAAGVCRHEHDGETKGGKS